MLIFMELCAEGTLENLVSATENGLPEALLRRFTKQLVSGVDVLHQHAIVHRDIKSKMNESPFKEKLYFFYFKI